MDRESRILDRPSSECSSTESTETTRKNLKEYIIVSQGRNFKKLTGLLMFCMLWVCMDESSVITGRHVYNILYYLLSLKSNA